MLTYDQKAARERLEKDAAYFACPEEGAELQCRRHPTHIATDLRTLLSERDALAERVAVLEGQGKPVATCDGIEQGAFEEWAKARRFDMTEHPLHYLFLDEKTDAARQGWKAGLEHAVSRAHPTPEALARAETWRPITDDTDATIPIWAALRVRHNGGPYEWQVHLIACDDETGDLLEGFEHGWALEDYEFWQPANIPLSPSPATQEGE
jgi:hypothetical protein